MKIDICDDHDDSDFRLIERAIENDRNVQTLKCRFCGIVVKR